MLAAAARERRRIPLSAVPVIDIGPLFPHLTEGWNDEAGLRSEEDAASSSQASQDERKRPAALSSSHHPNEQEASASSISPSKRYKSDPNTRPSSYTTRLRRQEQWEEMYERLKSYRERHGDCNVPSTYKEDKQLANWVAWQRRLFRKKASKEGNDNISSGEHQVGLSADCIEKLQNLGFRFILQRDTDIWSDRLEELKAFKEEHGHGFVPTEYAANQKLAHWARNQRLAYRAFIEAKKQDASTNCCMGMTEERIAVLEGIGFKWCSDERKPRGLGRSHVSWQTHYEMLKEYQKEHGHCSVPESYANKKLANWVKNQRAGHRRYREAKKNGRPTTFCLGMTEERIAELDKIGFKWRCDDTCKPAQSRVPWAVHYEMLKDHKKKSGHCNVPQHYPQCPKLGQWVRDQRVMYRKFMKAKADGITTRFSSEREERIAKLEALGFVWKAAKGPKGKKAA